MSATFCRKMHGSRWRWCRHQLVHVHVRPSKLSVYCHSLLGVERCWEMTVTLYTLPASDEWSCGTVAAGLTERCLQCAITPLCFITVHGSDGRLRRVARRSGATGSCQVWRWSSSHTDQPACQRRCPRIVGHTVQSADCRNSTMH